MTKVGIYAFNSKRIALVMHITHMFSRINHIYMPGITIRKIGIRRRSAVNYSLDSVGRFITSNIKTYYLLGIALYHSYYIVVLIENSLQQQVG